MTDTETDRSEQVLDEIRAVLRGGECRIETGFTFGVKGTYATVRLFKRNGRKWEKVGPLPLPPDGEGLPSLLRLIADLSDEAVAA